VADANSIPQREITSPVAAKIHRDSGCILRGSCRTYGKNAERIRECRVISSERQDHQVAPAPSASSTRTPWSMATATTSCGARR